MTPPTVYNISACLFRFDDAIAIVYPQHLVLRSLVGVVLYLLSLYVGQEVSGGGGKREVIDLTLMFQTFVVQSFLPE